MTVILSFLMTTWLCSSCRLLCCCLCDTTTSSQHGNDIWRGGGAHSATSTTTQLALTYRGKTRVTLYSRSVKGPLKCYIICKHPVFCCAVSRAVCCVLRCAMYRRSGTSTLPGWSSRQQLAAAAACHPQTLSATGGSMSASHGCVMPTRHNPATQLPSWHCCRR